MPARRHHARSGSTGACTKVAVTSTPGAPCWSASTRNGMVLDRRSHWRRVARSLSRTSAVPPGSMPTAGGSKSPSTRWVGSMRCMRQLACALPWFSTRSSYTVRRRARSAGWRALIRRSKVDATCSVISAFSTSSGELCGTTRMPSVVGPAVVLGRRGGLTWTCTVSCAPPNSVTYAGRTVLHPAARPDGVSAKLSVALPRLVSVSSSRCDVPGSISVSLLANQACTVTTPNATGRRSPVSGSSPEDAHLKTLT